MRRLSELVVVAKEMRSRRFGRVSLAKTFCAPVPNVPDAHMASALLLAAGATPAVSPHPHPRPLAVSPPSRPSCCSRLFSSLAPAHPADSVSCLVHEKAPCLAPRHVQAISRPQSPHQRSRSAPWHHACAKGHHRAVRANCARCDGQTRRQASMAGHFGKTSAFAIGLPIECANSRSSLKTAATMTMNSPESMAALFQVASASQQQPDVVKTAEFMREVGLKCISFNGVRLSPVYFPHKTSIY